MPRTFGTVGASLQFISGLRTHATIEFNVSLSEQHVLGLGEHGLRKHRGFLLRIRIDQSCSRYSAILEMENRQSHHFHGREEPVSEHSPNQSRKTVSSFADETSIRRKNKVLNNAR